MQSVNPVCPKQERGAKLPQKPNGLRRRETAGKPAQETCAEKPRLLQTLEAVPGEMNVISSIQRPCNNVTSARRMLCEDDARAGAIP